MKHSTRTIVMLLVVSLLLTMSVTILSACTGDYDVILMTDKQNVEDGAYNQELFYALKSYCEKHNLTFCSMSPMSPETKEYRKTLKTALENYNADYVITPSTAFAEILTEEFTAPYVEKGQKFIFLAGTNHNAEYAGASAVRAEYNNGVQVKKGDVVVEGKESLVGLEGNSVKYERELYSAPEGVSYVNINENELGFLVGYLAAKSFGNVGFYASNTSAVEYVLAKVDGNIVEKPLEEEYDGNRLYQSAANYYNGFLHGVDSAIAAGSTTAVRVSTIRSNNENGDQNKNAIQKSLVEKSDFVFSVAGSDNKLIASKAVVAKKISFNVDDNLTSDSNYTYNMGHAGINFSGIIEYLLSSDPEDVFGHNLVLGIQENAIMLHYDAEVLEAVSANSNNASLIQARGLFDNNRAEAIERCEECDFSSEVSLTPERIGIAA